MADRRYAPASDVRQWALESGHRVSAGNGRLARWVIDAFNDTHPTRPYIDGYGTDTAKRDAVIYRRRTLAGEPT